VGYAIKPEVSMRCQITTGQRCAAIPPTISVSPFTIRGARIVLGRCLGTLRSQAARTVIAFFTVTPLAAVAAPPSQSAPPGHLIVQGDGASHAISPMLYGLMTEEINYSYDGGLYGELIRNRIFQDNPPPPPRNRRAMATQPAVTEFPPSPAPDQPVYWSLL